MRSRRVPIDVRGRPGATPDLAPGSLPRREESPQIHTDWPRPLGVGTPSSGWVPGPRTVEPSATEAPGRPGVAEPAPSSRRLGQKVAVAAVAGLVLIGALLHGSHPNPPALPTAPPAVAGAGPGPIASAHHIIQTMGMPMPTGDRPVRPIDVVIDPTGQRFPASARRALAAWLHETQNPGTRVRLADGGRLSAPLTAATWRADPYPALSPGRPGPWLDHGVARHRAGALIRLGGVARTGVASRDVRLSVVQDDPTILGVRGELASHIARRVMVSADQGFGGLTAPGP
jgi:hypothetical protein